MEDRSPAGSRGAAQRRPTDTVPAAGRAARFRAAYPRALALGLAASAAIHFVGALGLGLAGVRLLPRTEVPAPLAAVELLPPASPEAPPAVRIPPPSLPVPAPPDPPVAPIEAPEPPPEPAYVAHDVPPRLVNVAQVRSVLEERYPSDLPEDAGEGQVVLWLFVDERGEVTKLRLRLSSGWRALDRLAEEIAPVMRFRPALHMGRSVGVWVSQPIRFRPDTAGRRRRRGRGAGREHWSPGSSGRSIAPAVRTSRHLRNTAASRARRSAPRRARGRRRGWDPVSANVVDGREVRTCDLVSGPPGPGLPDRARRASSRPAASATR